MKRNKIVIAAFSIFLLWMGYIWTKYHFVYKNYTQEEINEIFKKEGKKPPIIDSVSSRNYQVYYLTNQLNDTVKANEVGIKKPYLYLLHEPGENSSYFLDYFKDSLLNKTFHIVAPDRFGFGKTHLRPFEGEASEYIFKPEEEEFGELTEFLSMELEGRVLDAERKYLDEVRSISNGDAAMIALTNLNTYALNTKRYFFFNPNFKERNFMMNSYSTIISKTPLQYLFPRPYVNKQKDLLMIEKAKKEFFKSFLKNSKNDIQDVMKKEGMYYTTDGTKGYKPAFYYAKNKSKAKSLQKILGSKDTLKVESENIKNIHTDIDKITKEIFKAEDHTIIFRRINYVPPSNEVIIIDSE